MPGKYLVTRHTNKSSQKASPIYCPTYGIQAADSLVQKMPTHLMNTDILKKVRSIRGHHLKFARFLARPPKRLLTGGALQKVEILKVVQFRTV